MHAKAHLKPKLHRAQIVRRNVAKAGILQPNKLFPKPWHVLREAERGQLGKKPFAEAVYQFLVRNYFIHAEYYRLRSGVIEQLRKAIESQPQCYSFCCGMRAGHGQDRFRVFIWFPCGALGGYVCYCLAAHGLKRGYGQHGVIVHIEFRMVNVVRRAAGLAYRLQRGCFGNGLRFGPLRRGAVCSYAECAVRHEQLRFLPYVYA